MPVLLALVALIGASRDRHRGPTARDHRPRRIARPLVDVVSVRSLLEVVDGGKLVTVVRLPNEPQALP